MTLLLPVSVVSALVLMVIGVPQTLQPSLETSTLEGIVNNNSSNSQTINLGPVASLESIKLLGINGGGFFGLSFPFPFPYPMLD